MKSLDKKKQNGISLTENLNEKNRVKIQFDTDQEKCDWLNNQIERNGGKKDLKLAIQVVLQKNQKAFLRSWSLQQSKA